MKFTPERYRIEDISGQPFIDPEEIWEYINHAQPTMEKVWHIIERSLNKNRLSLEEVALLIKAEDPEMVRAIKEGARKLKEMVYGQRIVLFAPLYVGNSCINNCKYCGFKASNRQAVRRTLTRDELIENVKALEDEGQKRLILVYGEHPSYTPEYIASTVRTVYQVKKGNGEIRRVNINAAPMDVEGFRTIKQAGIGTYQIFQETYHPEAYTWYHPSGKKKDYAYRLVSLDRAQEAGIDDVGIGALLGLYDWRFEVMALVRHTSHLEACFNVGPHTISFPRVQDASDYQIDERFRVSDEEFVRLIAILRLAVPYTGMILTAREPAHVRDEVLQFGCSQIDGGTRLELGAYAEEDRNKLQNLNLEQFLINDDRSLNEVINELINKDYIPSFCTACYRKGRTGEHFMEFSVPGFIKRFCTPNALLTLAEYLCDYAPPTTRERGWELVQKNLDGMEASEGKKELEARLERIRHGERDLYF